MQVNGKTKVGLSIAGAIAILVTVFGMGVNWARIEGHIESKERHENGVEKSRRIDERIGFAVRPLEVKIDTVLIRQDRLDAKLDSLLEAKGEAR